jgi:regulator of chromosome condensation
MQAVAVTAGGMHTLALSAKFSLYSWGVNDEAALGRPAGGEAWCRSRYSGPIQQSDTPGLVEMPKDASKCCLLSAGDSHSAVATATGHVYVWGTFRDESGVMGFSPRERFAVRSPSPLQRLLLPVWCMHTRMDNLAGIKLKYCFLQFLM